MKHPFKGLFSALCAFMLLAPAASAASLDELEGLAGSSPEDYGRVFDKDLASATLGSQPQMARYFVNFCRTHGATH
jgi:hypothetical protein